MDEQLTADERLTSRFTDETLDRRRAGKGSWALLLKGAESLPQADRVLLKAVFGDGRSTAEVARMRGVSPRTVAHQVRRLSRRVLSPEFAFVVAKRRAWSRSRARVATLCFIQGCSIRDAARKTRLSFHAVRRHHDAVLALMSPGSSDDSSVGRLPQEAASSGEPMVLGGAA
jgi:DNA-directed RNA polymerase specialized sigma24 family protein